MQQNMLQWLHMDNIINNFEDKLVKYDILLKYRFDLDISDKDFLHKISLIPNIPNILYNNSDLMFFTESLTFINIFKTFYAKLKYYTYISNRHDNDNNFDTSWKSELALQLHLKNINIHSKRIYCVRVIRGSYNKEHEDGNKK